MELTSDAIFSDVRAEAGVDVEAAVRTRYAAGAERVEAALCCPTDGYDPRYLRLLPREILEKDYGCGDPSRYVGPGETVVDLGCGVGKICYILAQRVGAGGLVIGLDFNDAMLDVARKHRDEMAERLGYRNVEFHKARIQDMGLDLERARQWLDARPIASIEQAWEFEAYCEGLRREAPLIADATVDVVVSNCVLNLVKADDKRRLLTEIHRVLRAGGRAVISDIVCDEDPTPEIMSDPDLWSGCIAGSFREDALLAAFEEAGFQGIEILSRADAPWRVVDGIEFRPMTVRAHKGRNGPCLERHQAVIYRGPWKQVRDDDGHVLHRGRRMAVCDKTYGLLTDPDGPYAAAIIPLPVPAAAHAGAAAGRSTCCADDACCPPMPVNGESKA